MSGGGHLNPKSEEWAISWTRRTVVRDEVGGGKFVAIMEGVQKH